MAVPKSRIIHNNLYLIIGHQRFKLDIGEWDPFDEINEGWTHEGYLSWYKSMLDSALASIYEVDWEHEHNYP